MGGGWGVLLMNLGDDRDITNKPYKLYYYLNDKI